MNVADLLDSLLAMPLDAEVLVLAPDSSYLYISPTAVDLQDWVLEHPVVYLVTED